MDEPHTCGPEEDPAGLAFECLKLFWSDDIMDHLVKHADGPMTADCLWKYLIVLLALGYLKLPTMSHYWQEDDDGLCGVEYFKRMMSGREYSRVRGSIHYSYDYLQEMLNYNFKEHWSPSPVLAIDECMVLFEGRCSFRQHVRGKPHATGLKFYVMADHTGFNYAFWLYKGSQSTESNKQKDLAADLVQTLFASRAKPEPPGDDCISTEASLQQSVIHEDQTEEGESEYFFPTSDDDERELLPNHSWSGSDTEEEDDDLPQPRSDHALSLEDLEMLGEEETIRPYLIIADSYFGSVEAASRLEDLGVYYCLAMRKNTNAAIKKPLYTGLKKGQWRTLYQSSPRQAICVFHDKAHCSFISNFRGGERGIRRGKAQDLIPEVVGVYNKYMNCVDMFDYSLGMNWNTHRSQKWTQTFLYTLLKMAVTNAWHYYSKRYGKTCSTSQFHELILRHGLKVYGNPTCSNTSPSGDHCIVWSDKTGKCKCCRSVKKNSSTSFRCEGCQVFLHPKNCFAKYHNVHH